MTTDRPARRSTGPDDRILEAITRLGDRVDTAVERIDDRLEAIDRRQAGGEQDVRAIRAELAEVRRDLAETRDVARLEGSLTRDGQATSVTAAAATGAAQGSAQGAMEATKTLKGWQVGIALMTVLTTITTLLSGGGAILHGFLKLMGVMPESGGD